MPSTTPNISSRTPGRPWIGRDLQREGQRRGSRRCAARATAALASSSCCPMIFSSRNFSADRATQQPDRLPHLLRTLVRRAAWARARPAPRAPFVARASSPTLRQQLRRLEYRRPSASASKPASIAAGAVPIAVRILSTEWRPLRTAAGAQLLLDARHQRGVDALLIVRAAPSPATRTARPGTTARSRAPDPVIAASIRGDQRLDDLQRSSAGICAITGRPLPNLPMSTSATAASPRSWARRRGPPALRAGVPAPSRSSSRAGCCPRSACWQPPTDSRQQQRPRTAGRATTRMCGDVSHAGIGASRFRGFVAAPRRLRITSRSPCISATAAVRRGAPRRHRPVARVALARR